MSINRAIAVFGMSLETLIHGIAHFDNIVGWNCCREVVSCIPKHPNNVIVFAHLTAVQFFSSVSTANFSRLVYIALKFGSFVTWQVFSLEATSLCRKNIFNSRLLIYWVCNFSVKAPLQAIYPLSEPFWTQL